MLGVGAGQQSRVDCVKLAGNKVRQLLQLLTLLTLGQQVKTWWLRQHPKLLGLEFKSSVKRQVISAAIMTLQSLMTLWQARVNARVRFIEGDMSDIERTAWEENFDQVKST